MNFFERRKRLKGVNYLELTPLRRYEYVTTEEGKVTILVPRFESNLFKNLFQPRAKSPLVNFHLDELGSAVWLRMDGTRKVSDICSELELELGEKIAPAAERVTRFLTQLYLNKMITFKEIT